MGGTTRYLVYEIGTRDLEHKNWAIRIQKIQRPLLTATRVATSVENRVLILNSIVLPSLLFTASVFDIPDWAEKELRNLYKKFLWAHASTTDAMRHKVNPGLLVTPRQAGGGGYRTGRCVGRSENATSMRFFGSPNGRANTSQPGAYGPSGDHNALMQDR
uniref:RxLR effector candidate protein n=1 Tax=Hyaloperonospora arabidopsidis (strain Emoy2) TaxID=559515 RepID=M4C326_HYAAE